MRTERVGLIAVCVGLALAALGGAAQAQESRSEGLLAAADKVDITPTHSVYMAGYAGNRRSVGAHDPLMARCLVMQQGPTRIAFVSCDLLGVPRYQIEQIRAKVRSVAPEHLYIAATHTHSGPDTLGQWGPDLQTSGVDQEWMAGFRAKVARLVDATAARLQPAVLKFASTKQVPRISKNIRVPQILDTELGVMQVLARDTQKPIATLVNYACHPEILTTHHLTADFDETTAPKGENWQAAEAIGTSLGQRAQELLGQAEIVREAPIQTQQRVFTVPLENAQFKALIALKVFPNLLKDGQIETEVNRITIGPAEFLTLPGEVLPNIGLYLKRLMSGQPKFLLGLTCDELGYILTPEDYGLDLYRYETSVSVGSEMGARMEQNLRALLLTDGRKRARVGKH